MAYNKKQTDNNENVLDIRKVTSNQPNEKIVRNKKKTGDDGNTLDIRKVASGYLATLNNALIGAMGDDVASREDALEARETAKAVKRKKVAKQLAGVEKAEKATAENSVKAKKATAENSVKAKKATKGKTLAN